MVKHDKLLDVLNSTAAGLHQAGVMDLNTSPSTIQQWERGQKHPNGMALKLLNLVDSKGLQALA
jgi:putative transcriptional regulator